MQIRNILLVAFFLANITILYSQQAIEMTDSAGKAKGSDELIYGLDPARLKTTLNIKGPRINDIISLKSKIELLNVDNNNAQTNIFYRVNNGKTMLYNGNFIPLEKLADGYHRLEYYAIDKDNIKEETQIYNFYLDINSPIITTDVLGDRFYVNEKIYFSGRTKLKFTAVDNKSGVKEIFYSLDGNNFVRYEVPFYMPSKSGPYSIKYYGYDNLDNQGTGDPNSKYDEYKHSSGVIYLDLTGPSLKHSFVGLYSKNESQLFISKNTWIKLFAEDPESGLKKITYRFDSLSEEMVYQKPFRIASDSVQKLEYYGYDNVNNRNINSISFITDNEAPTIIYMPDKEPVTTKKGVTTFPANISIHINVNDEKAGIKEALFSINGSAVMPLKNPLNGFEKNRVYKIITSAKDKLGNLNTKEFVFHTDK
ncbi:MAG: OmpL47-type beta-barrel domain-containing protein [Cytophagales bacterium]